MRITKIILKDFKRFDDLTIDLGSSSKKIIALVGPNGSGKSSVFDAFEEQAKAYKSDNSGMNASYFSKLFFSIIPGNKSEEYNRGNAVKIFRENNQTNFIITSFYIRSAYRYIARLRVEQIRAQPDITIDQNRPGFSGAIDSRLQENYERLIGSAFTEFFDGTSTKTGTQVKQELIGKINRSLNKVLDIQITSLGDVIGGKGQLFFEKGTSKDFPYENLSSGEKEVVDIIVDLIVKTPIYTDTVFCIDEPELHLNTAIQRKLLIEIEQLIPDTCQLWLATHSIGFLRALQEELKEKSQIIDFSEKDYFNGTQTIVPIKSTRQNWLRIFKTALEDLTGLIAPQTIYYCEGRPQPSPTGEEQGLDALIYNEIFSEEFHNTLFISGGGGDVLSNAGLGLQILSKAFTGLNVRLLKDKDDKSDVERTAFLAASTLNRMLDRREIENYLFDPEIVEKYCLIKGMVFDPTTYAQIVTDVKNQDIKAIPTPLNIKRFCIVGGKFEDLKKELGKLITPDTAVYTSLKAEIFLS